MRESGTHASSYIRMTVVIKTRKWLLRITALHSQSSHGNITLKYTFWLLPYEVCLHFMHNDSSKFSIFTRDIILLPKSQDPWSLWAVLWKFGETTVVNGRGKYFIIEQPINQQNQPIRRTLSEFPRAQPANPFYQ